MRINSNLLTIIAVLGFAACNGQDRSNPELQEMDSKQKQITNDMNSFIALFEIPATDISRAVNFYETILGIEIE